MPPLTEDDVRRLIDDKLADPLSFPKEFKSWVPSWTEVSGIQLPIGQIVGTYVVASTVAGLGPGVHGRTGVIRAGVSPYEFIKVTYDQVYLKWVSDPVTMASRAKNAAPVVVTGTNGAQAVTDAESTFFSCKVWETAGLVAQFRHFAFIAISNAASTANCSLNITGADGDSTTTTLGVLAGSDLSVTGSTSVTFKIGAWRGFNASTLGKDHMWASVNLWPSNAAHNAQLWGTAVMLRWVSA